MRLKIFSAPTIAEAMDQVRAELGDDAIIMSIDSDDDGARITAALEGPELDPFLAVGKAEASAGAALPDMDMIGGEVRQALTYHGVPGPLADRIVLAASVVGAETGALALAGAFDTLFAFAPLPARPPSRPWIFIGPPGAGKTLAVAKMATRARRAGRRATVISTDTRRAGGIQQLEAFTRILGLDLLTASSPEELGAAIEGCGGDPVYIDTAGINPFAGEDTAMIRGLVKASAAEPVVVLPAGGDAMETMDAAASFAAVGGKRLIATRIDAARRLGGLLAAADGGKLSFCGVSVSHHAADPIVSVNPVALARLILPDTAGVAPTPEVNEAMQ